MSEQYYQNVFNPFLNGKTKGDYKGPFTHNTTTIVSEGDKHIDGTIDLEPILSFKAPFTIGIMINFDRDFHGHRNGEVTCKQTITVRVNRPQQLTTVSDTHRFV